MVRTSFFVCDSETSAPCAKVEAWRNLMPCLNIWKGAVYSHHTFVCNVTCSFAISNALRAMFTLNACFAFSAIFGFVFAVAARGFRPDAVTRMM